jgi:hypothetical protein
MERMAITFYCDDTGPYGYPPDTFKRFLDFAVSEGIAGESSVILGSQSQTHGLLSRPTTDAQRAYVEQLHRAYECGIDTHMEIMTHRGLYDFERERVPEEAMHEGVWLRDPEVSVEAYASYFSHITGEGEKIGLKFTGLTLPGCGCDACARRRLQIGETDFYHGINPKVWQGLLEVAKEGKFRGPTVSCFIGYDEGQHEPVLAAGEGAFGVYDIAPNTRDRFGIWLNEPEHVDPDYYIAADGESGRIVELHRQGAPACVFYAHWQGLNPYNGFGWEAFTQVVRRVQTFLGDQVVWVRPSDLADQVHARQAGG